MSLIANSPQARSLANHIIHGAMHLGVPIGWSPGVYRRRLRELARAGVLRAWEWTVDGQRFVPYCPVAGRLWLAGPRFSDYLEEARRLGCVTDQAFFVRPVAPEDQL